MGLAQEGKDVLMKHVRGYIIVGPGMTEMRHGKYYPYMGG